MAINNSLGQDGGTGTQILRSNGGATPPSFQDLESCALPIISGATFSTLGEFNIANLSNGVITGCALSDGGSGTLDVASGSIMIRSSASDTATIFSADYAGTTGEALTDNSANFVYIFYNAGTPIFSTSTTPLTTVQNYVILGIVYREGTTLHISEVNIPTTQVAQKLGRRLALVNGVTWQVGLSTTETGTRNLAMTAGTVWLALTSYSVAAKDTSAADTWIYYYSDGAGGFTEVTGSTQIDNTQYDDGSGSLATLSNNKYGVHWVYRGIDDDFYVVYGTGDYSLTEAQDAVALASLPLHLTNLHAILCAKVIIQKSASSFTEIASAFVSQFTPGTPSNHNDLGALQGGTADEYFHLTSAEYNLTGILTGNGASIMSASTVTQYGVVVAGASNAVTSVAPSATSGVPLIGQGSSANPAFGTAVVAGGGTGTASHTAYAVLCGGTTGTGAIQSIASVGTSGQVLTSNGAAALPTMQTLPAATDVNDSTFRIQDNGDPSKEIAFEASGITGSTVRTITMPDADITLLIPSNVAITGGAIDGTTIGATTPAAGTFDDLTLDDISGSYADAEQVFKQAGVQTTNTTPTQIAAITLTTNTMVTVEARFNGFIDDYSASCGGRVFYTARRVAGGAVEVGVPIVDVIEDSAGAPTVDADVSGNDVRLLVTGVGVETWNWTVSYNYNFTKTNA